MNVEIIGAGALGMLLAAKLSLAGAQVQLITRTKKQAEAIEEQGLHFTPLSTEETGAGKKAPLLVKPWAVKAYEEVQTARSLEWKSDCVLLTVKQTSITGSFAAFVGGRLQGGTRLVCFQNGIGHTELLTQFIPASQISLAVTTEGALRRHLTHVEHTGAGMTWIGSLETFHSDTADDQEQKKLELFMEKAGFDASLSNQINSKVWNKLLINAVINPLTAILQVTNGELPKLPAAFTLMGSLFEEGAALADKLGIALAPDLWEQLLDVCRRTAANRSSMLQDVQARRLTELDSITGGLLAKARSMELKLPSHEAVYALVRAIEQHWSN